VANRDRRSDGEPRDWLLYHGIRNLLRCDGAKIVTELARFIFDQHGSLRLLSRVVEATRGSLIPAAITLLGALKSSAMVRRPARPDGVLWVARLANERRVLEPLASLTPDLTWNEVKLNWRVPLRDVGALLRSYVGTGRRLLRLARRLHERHDSFKVLRVMELVGYYMSYRRVFDRGRYALAVMSSHSNPHGIAFNLAARHAGVPVVLVTHGMPVRPVAKLAFDLAVVHCEDARDTYVAEGCRIRHVLVHGRRQHVAAMPAGELPNRLTVGVFLCKDVNEQRLHALIESLLGCYRVARILVRPHPFNMWVALRSWLAAVDDSRVVLSTGGSVFEDIAASNVVLAGNTSVHIEAVLAGRPSAYVADLDHAPRDLHRFVASRLIYELTESLRFTPDEMLAFYRRRDWPETLRRFAKVDDDELAVTAEAVAITRRLISGA
jgi:hypothetical protein